MHHPTDPPSDPSDAAAAEPSGATEPGSLAPPDASTGVEATPAETPTAASDPPVAPAAGDMSPAACGARLAELFPALFIAPNAPGPFKPIKLRIHADIQARAPGVFTRRTLGVFFSRYTTSTAYLKALASAPHRFDLDGAPAGEIAEEHRAAAAEELARRRALVLERRAAERKTQVPRQPAPAASEGEAATVDRPPRARQSAERRGDGAPDRPRRDGRRDGHRDGRRDEQRHAPPRRPPGAGPRSAPRGDSAPQRAPAAPALPVDPAQRERAMLLRAFEASPLSKANFCVLKRIGEAELDALLAQARAERG